MKIKKNICLVIVMMISLPMMAMKRAGAEIVISGSLKRYCDDKVLLKRSIEKPDFKAFEKIIREDTTGIYINKEYNKEPLFFSIINQIDTFRSNSNKNTNDDELIDKNNKAIQDLHLCLNEILMHKYFDSESKSSQGIPLIRFLIDRRFTALYSDVVEKESKYLDEHFIFLNLLKKNKALAHQWYKGSTPLHSVCLQSYGSINVFSSESHLKIAESLIEYGADINATTLAGNTPLHLCCDNIRMTLLLLAKGACFTKKNDDGETPADCSRNPKVRTILENECVIKEKIAEIEKKVSEIIKLNISFHMKQKSLFHNIEARQKKSIPYVKTIDLYLYTQAILELTKDCTVKQMIEEMAYEDEDEPIDFADLRVEISDFLNT